MYNMIVQQYDMSKQSAVLHNISKIPNVIDFIQKLFKQKYEMKLKGSYDAISSFAFSLE